MKRKFVKVMLFGALTLAVSTTVTSCKDYDDDVKNLQEQIDKINSSSPVSIEDMKTAIAAAKTELATEIDKLSKALDNKEASIETLKGEIETLKKKLDDAQGDAEAAKKLATELSNKQNELKALVDANDETLKKLKASYDQLTGAEGDIQKLQQFVADYEQNKVISEYAKSDDLLAAFINSTIAEKLEGKDLVEYINTAVSTAIAQELVSVNQSITAITGKDGSLTKLQAQLNAALNGDEENMGILDRLDELTSYFESNLDFYQYYRSKATHLDNHYFVRGHIDFKLCPNCVPYDRDPEFSTCYDHKAAQILANDMLCIYLNKKLHGVDKQVIIAKSRSFLPEHPFRWTATKIAAVELGYAIYAAGVLNNGQADIKEIMTFMEASFQIDLGDYYRTYITMKDRKKDRTSFLNSLIKSLLKKMDEDDNL